MALTRCKISHLVSGVFRQLRQIWFYFIIFFYKGLFLCHFTYIFLFGINRYISTVVYSQKIEDRSRVEPKISLGQKDESNGPKSGVNWTIECTKITNTETHCQGVMKWLQYLAFNFILSSGIYFTLLMFQKELCINISHITARYTSHQSHSLYTCTIWPRTLFVFIL